MKKSIRNLALVGALALIPGSAAALTLGFEGVNDYSGSILEPNCAYGDRAGATYVQNLDKALASHPRYFMYINDSAWESDVHEDGWINKANFFVFAGHGLRYDYWPELNDMSSAHFYSQKGNPNYHNSSEEGSDSVNATWDEVRMGSTGTLRFASFYSCNWLTNGGSQARQNKISQMFEGVNLVTGFASVMYLDSREGTTYGNYLEAGVPVKKAWFDAAQEWQTQLDPPGSTVYARVVGHISAENDTFYSYKSSVPTYNEDPSNYKIWTLPISTTGVKK